MFTTLQDHSRITVADIPGLVEGAADNRGLGHDFLRHIERTKVSTFVVNMWFGVVHFSGCKGLLLFPPSSALFLSH